MASLSHADALERIDRAAARLASDDPQLAQWARQYARVQRHRLAGDLQCVVEQAAPDARLLECGASPPLLTLALADLGFSVVGVDIAPQRFAETIARERLDLRAVDIERESLPLESNQFDVVLFNEILEHLRIDLIFTLTEVARVLRPGGTLLLSTPNHRSLRGLWRLVWNQRGCHMAGEPHEEFEKLTRLGHMGHVREYTAHEVRGLLTRVGLVVQEVRWRFPDALPRGPLALLAGVERAVCLFAPSWRPHFTMICGKAVSPGLGEGQAKPAVERADA